ncbi:MAG: asparagine synthase [Gammaproteobacteria bacterium]|nr:asparagine synthase [Gammaproteobacteria bacterium]
MNRLLGIAGDIGSMSSPAGEFDDGLALAELTGSGLSAVARGDPGLAAMGVLATGRPLAVTGALTTARAWLAALPALGGSFVLVTWDEGQRLLSVATDRFASLPVYYSFAQRRLAFGTDAAWVLRNGRLDGRLDPQALYDYLFFSVVPSNRGIVSGLMKIPPASILTLRDGRITVQRYWTPDFRRGPLDRRQLAKDMVERVRAAVTGAAQLPDTGCFLSGGLDSSTVCGMASQARGGAVPAFTIGYDVPEFDESRYARITAAHFGLDLHEHCVRSTDVAHCMSKVINAFDEPFGNPSALSAYLCAQFAREAGVSNLLAGDGGDELFGGNERYRKQAVFELYGRLPGLLRAGFVDPLSRLLRHAPGPLPKLMSYVRQARVPLPDRLYSYNLLVRHDVRNVLTPAFLADVDVESPYEYARNLYRVPPSGDSLDRMLYLDWTTTLTDNDLPKVTVACRLAGVQPHFPLLDPGIVDVSLQIPSREKLDLRVLRKFYKSAFRDFLPGEIIRKPKHGFGVPVGIWVNRDESLRASMRERLASLARRDIVLPGLLDQLLDLQTSEYPSYYGSLLWPLFALEEWLQGHGY